MLIQHPSAAVVFAVNILLTQRIIRSMHPQIGWSRPFSLATRSMALSVPLNIVLLISSLIGFFLSNGVPTRLAAFEGLLKFGVSWNIVLVTFPFLAVGIACAFPGPKPEKFGRGHLRVKTSLVMFSSALLTTGAVVRTYAIFNPRSLAENDVLYGKPVFYTTQFMLEAVVVAGYALLRFDLLFHIPNGSSRPGDYSATNETEKGGGVFAREDIEEQIAACKVPHQILAAPYSQRRAAKARDYDDEQPVFVVFFPSSSSSQALETLAEGELPPRPNVGRVSRRQSYMEGLRRSRMALQGNPRAPMRPMRDSTVYV